MLKQLIFGYIVYKQAISRQMAQKERVSLSNWGILPDICVNIICTVHIVFKMSGYKKMRLHFFNIKRKFNTFLSVSFAC